METIDKIKDENGVYTSDPSVIAICGSMKFWEFMLRWYARLSADGFIVLLPVKIPDVNIGLPFEGNELKKKLRALQLHKIDMADYIVVVNPHGYIGEDTEIEINYAESKGKHIEYLNPPCSPAEYDEKLKKIQEILSSAQETGYGLDLNIESIMH